MSLWAFILIVLIKHYDNYDIFKFHFYVFSTSRPENATSPKDMIRDAQ